MGEFFVQVVRIGEVTKHPNADRLSITTVHGGYPVVFTTGDYKEGDLAVYVPVDAVVPDTAEWAWLAPKGSELRPKDRRIRAKRLRGVFSMGLLTDAPPGAVEGQDVAELLGITRYDDEPEPQPLVKPQKPKGLWARLKAKFYAILFPHKREASEAYKPRKLKHLPGYYDIEPFRRYGGSTFKNGEVVVVTEKLHGQNASFVHDGKKLYCKSRTRWRSNDPKNNDWAAVAARYDLDQKLKEHPGVVL